MDMKFKFVDVQFEEISSFASREQRYAVDLGIRTILAEDWLPVDNLHYFVSAVPWVKGVNKKGACAFLHELQKLNPEVVFDLLSLKQIECLNDWGSGRDFKIRNCWTCSAYEDWHGRTDGYCSLKDGRSVIDWGENETDVYFVFGFDPGWETQIILPE